MVGNHKSGRKPNPDGSLERSKKYTFYVKEYAQTNANGNIISWIEDSYFQWFKRKHGAQWQERIRAYMRWEIQAWKRDHHWRCDCEPIGILQNYKHNRVPKCHSCGKYRRKIDQINDMSTRERIDYNQSLIDGDTE